MHWRRPHSLPAPEHPLVERAGVGPRLHEQPRDLLVPHQAGPVQRGVAALVGHCHILRQRGGTPALVQALRPGWPGQRPVERYVLNPAHIMPLILVLVHVPTPGPQVAAML